MSQVASTQSLLDVANQQRLAEICVRNRIKWLAMFGSVARGEARPESDVDLLVEFEADARVGYIKLEFIAEELSSIFDGRYVDIGSPRSLHWMIREQVLAEAKVLYAG